MNDNTTELCPICATALTDMGAHGWGCPSCATAEMDALDIPTFGLPAKLEHKLQENRRPALKRTGPASTRRNDASIAERENRDLLRPSGRLGRRQRSS